MRIVNQFLGAAALATVLCGSAFAQRVEVRGVGSLQYEGKLFSSDKPSDDERSRAVALARQAAWKNYVATLNPARQQLIMSNEAALLSHVDDFIIDAVLIEAVRDPESKTVRAVVRAAINDEAVNQYLAKVSVGDPQKAARSQDSTFTFLFMSRRVTSIRQFDARKTEVSEASAARTTAADGAVSAQLVTSSGGSRLQKEDAMTYAVSSSSDLDTAMGEVLSVSGIEYVAYDDVVSNCNGVAVKKFQDEFVNADELLPATRAAVIRAARECGVRYLAYGTLDSEAPAVDPVTGNQKVFVSVRASLWDITPKLPRRVGSVGPKQFSGLGPTQNVAARNALRLATNELAKGLVDQLNAKGIR